MKTTEKTEGGVRHGQKNGPVLPLWALIALSLILTVAASALLLPAEELPDDLPVFQHFRQAGTRKLFIYHHLDRAPLLYGLLHTLPGFVWSVCMPLQHVRHIRLHYPAVHRWSGRISILLSVTMTITGFILALKSLLYTQSMAHIHRLRIGQTVVLAWPSPMVWGVLCGPYLGFAAVQTYLSARKKDWTMHQRWANRTTLVGYIIPLQRVFFTPINVFGFVLPYLSKPGQHPYLHIPYDFEGKEQAEKAAFALTFWFATGTVVIVAFRNRNNRALF